MADQPAGKLADNILHFARVLRRTGLQIGPAQVVVALEAVETAGIKRRDDMHSALHAVFVTRRDQRELFDQAFHIFWRDPNLLRDAMSLVLPDIGFPDEESAKQELSRRVADAMRGTSPIRAARAGDQIVDEDARDTWSAEEILQRKDFEEMSAEEVREAKEIIKRLRLPIQSVSTRRFQPDRSGNRIDLRRTFRKTLRNGGNLIDLDRKKIRRRQPPLVVLCDISGSMSQYSRLFLHFLHAITNDRDRVFSFVFGTRLTNITRYLQKKDVDVALAAVSDAVEDWSGGTRIGQALGEFNRHWSRRVLNQGAVCLLVTDGLDRDAGAGLSHEMERLHMSVRRLIWLNPLLRFDGFEPRAQGVKAMLPHVDDFRAVHNIQSLKELAGILSGDGQSTVGTALLSAA